MHPARLKRRFLIGLSALAVAGILILFALVHVPGPSIPANAQPAGVVQVSLRSDLPVITPGTQVGIYATLTNTNPLPAYDGILYVRAIADWGGSEPEHVVSGFVAAHSIDIPASSATTTTFIWQVPTDLKAGQYYLVGYFAYPRDPFITPIGKSDISTSSLLSIRITSQTKGSVYIDPASLKAGDSAITSKAHVQIVKPTALEFKTVNNTAIPYDGMVTWQLYSNGDSPLSAPKNIGTTEVKVHTHKDATMRFVVPVLDAGTYYLEGTLAKGNTTQSVIGVTVDSNPDQGSSSDSAPLSLNQTDTFKTLATILVLVLIFFLWRRLPKR